PLRPEVAPKHRTGRGRLDNRPSPVADSAVDGVGVRIDLEVIRATAEAEVAEPRAPGPGSHDERAPVRAALVVRGRAQQVQAVDFERDETAARVGVDREARTRGDELE